MPQLDLGRLRFSYEGEYNGATTYERNDVVSYNNDVYVYTSSTPSSGNAPIDTSRWAKMVEGVISLSESDDGKFLTTDGLTSSWTDLITVDSVTTTNKLTSESLTYIGADAEAFETSAALTDAAMVVEIEGGSSSFAQLAFHNSEPTSSTDIIAYASNGNDSNGWVGIGITGEQFDDTTYGITGQGDSYLFSQTSEASATKSVTNKALASNVATLTATAHGFLVGQRVVVADVDSTFNGAFTITAKTDDTFSYAKSYVGTISSTAVSPAGTAKIQSKGNLVVATGDAGTDNNIVFAAGGYASGNAQMIIIPDQQVHIEIATASTSPTTGALRVAGGVGITGDTFTNGDVVLDGVLYVGPDAPAFETAAELTDAAQVTTITGGESSFAQMAFINKTATSSTDIIAYMDNGTDSEGWVGMGIAGSDFDDATFGITGPGDAYIFHETKSGPTGPVYTGNLVLATGENGSENKLVFAAGGFSSGTTQMEITPGVNVHIEIPTPSTSPTTGALTVVGGVGVQGDLNIEGNVSIEGTITFGGSGTTVETSNLAVTDPAVFVGTNNQSDIVDLAFIGEYATSVSTITRTVSNKALTGNIATLTTSADHTYLVGDVVVVSGVDATFNGTYNIIDVPTTTTFTYAKTASNVTSAVATGSAAVSARRKFAGIARDATDGVIKVFRDATTKPTSTVNFAEDGLTYASIKVGGAEIGTVTNTEIGYLSGVTSSIQTQLGARLTTSTAASTYAPLASPTLTGTPLSTTAAVDTNTTQIATTAYVVGQGYLKSATASSTYAPLTSAPLVRPVLTSALETMFLSLTASTGTIAFDVLTSSAVFSTAAATGNWTLNVRGNAGTTLNSLLSVGQAITITYLATTGAVAYFLSSFQVDGTTSGVTTRWQGGAAVTTGNASSVDAYTATIVKTANATFSVLVSQTRFA
jgi:hypothetical protein